MSNTLTDVIPLIDLADWRTGDAGVQAAAAAKVDQALRDSGFLMLANHDVDPQLAADLRSAAKAFFSLPRETKARYETTVGGRGWLPSGKEANSFAGEEADKATPDMKESLTMGRPYATGNPTLDSTAFAPNVWPDEVPELELLATTYMEAMYGLYDELLRMCGEALGLGREWFIERCANGTRTLNINRYPSLEETGVPKPGQFRVGAHTDWSIFTLLDRQPGYGGFQVQLSDDGEWLDAPFVEGTLLVNIGDLLARWTGDRWRSTRHRVLPPQESRPAEELISLIQFCDANVDAIVETMPAPIGSGTTYDAVLAGEYLRQRAIQATVK
ncbi:isopenicillin N synthase family oxygenase [Dietzia sp. E1]|jgi:isopenicillin N synthase-like dioxygenase|uniref:2OG-Fe(II) dioxygenase n=1 Tax=Dietzia sp. (strain D5) TaxID=1408143 RepID=W0C8M9_DIESD|nr:MULTISPECIES: 2-oxoglutarate and iron-dependent oxygenase domain-containing protein [Dietzia]AHE80581.1 2OG-Fe(II) dioxygenase [Dietzia sp. D5]EYT62486.1 oxidoreductase [Dietzia sp. UCD-THP]MBB1020773.1 isopenicillin N synthase family oxygenase [Dietzia sp. E1]MCT2141104.1 isopenicillin N synthase family oxygenase [Dietzia cinnamea]